MCSGCSIRRRDDCSCRELADQVRRAIARLSDSDREVLLLRHVEGLSNHETAFVLNLAADAVRKRHGRALLRLHAQLNSDGLEVEDL